MPKITLDAEAFKVLASDTRLQLLKSLDERPKTVSELGRELDLNKATVHEHLQQLLAGELIKKNEREGRKWVYYQLSWKGKSLLHPENTTVMILLGMAAMGSAGAVVQLGNWLRWWGMGKILGAEDSETGDTPPGDGPTIEQASEPESTDGQAQGSEPSDDSSMERSMAAPEEGNETAAAEGEPGPWYDFLDDGGFWIFAMLLLVATAALVGAMLVKQRAQNRVLEGAREVEEAQVGPPQGRDEGED